MADEQNTPPRVAISMENCTDVIIEDNVSIGFDSLLHASASSGIQARRNVTHAPGRFEIPPQIIAAFAAHQFGNVTDDDRKGVSIRAKTAATASGLVAWAAEHGCEAISATIAIMAYLYPR